MLKDEFWSEWANTWRLQRNTYVSRRMHYALDNTYLYTLDHKLFQKHEIYHYCITCGRSHVSEIIITLTLIKKLLSEVDDTIYWRNDDFLLDVLHSMNTLRGTTWSEIVIENFITAKNKIAQEIVKLLLMCNTLD